MNIEIVLFLIVMSLLVYGIGRFNGFRTGYNRGMDECEEKYKVTIKELKELIRDERGYGDYYR